MMGSQGRQQAGCPAFVTISGLQAEGKSFIKARNSSRAFGESGSGCFFGQSKQQLRSTTQSDAAHWTDAVPLSPHVKRRLGLGLRQSTVPPLMRGGGSRGSPVFEGQKGAAISSCGEPAQPGIRKGPALASLSTSIAALRG